VSEEFRQAWTAALDELELDVARAEAMLTDAHRYAEYAPADIWKAPTELGALPLELRPRADEILTRQLKAAEEIARRMVATKQQMMMTQRVETGEAVKRPVYLDCAM
jgi:hypothetical protein